MKYLLDTCTISHFVKGHPSISKQLKSCRPELISISSISVMEIEFGLALNLERAKIINPIIETLLSKIHILAFEKADAEVAGNLRGHLKKAGTPIGPYDLLIASQAIHHGLILVTQNTKEFSMVPVLTLEDWLA
ncbi:MAG: PIN domain-containing protein [Gammaproteobacteria bacterium]|nr:PIN domain-containing protein [Gammaproteobacteria bacterium]